MQINAEIAARAAQAYQTEQEGRWGSSDDPSGLETSGGELPVTRLMYDYTHYTHVELRLCATGSARAASSMMNVIRDYDVVFRDFYAELR